MVGSSQDICREIGYRPESERHIFRLPRGWPPGSDSFWKSRGRFLSLSLLGVFFNLWLTREFPLDRVTFQGKSRGTLKNASFCSAFAV